MKRFVSICGGNAKLSAMVYHMIERKRNTIQDGRKKESRDN